MILQNFTEFEAYKEAHKDFDIQLTLTHPDRSAWSIRHLQVGELHIQTGSDGCGDVAEGATRPDGWLFYFQASGSRGLVNGRRFEADSIVIAPPGAEFCLASQGTHDWGTVFFPTDCTVLPHFDLSANLGSLQVVRVGQTIVDGFVQTIASYANAVQDEPTVANEAACIGNMQEQLSQFAVKMMGVSQSAGESAFSSTNPFQLVQSAAQCIDRWPHMAPSISLLARELDVSERTLRSAFLSCLGIPPYQYLVAKRLNCARRLLLQSDPEQITVRQVAAKFGFWDYGRFAAKHRELFGELPSETLHRGNHDTK